METLAIYEFLDDFLNIEDETESETPLTLTNIVMQVMMTNNPRPRIEGFVEDVVPKMNNREFRRHFRVSLGIYNHLLDSFYGELKKVYRGGYLPISPEKQLLLYLWFAANQDSQREVAMLFGVGEWAVNKTIKQVSDVLCERKEHYIHWPSVQRENEIAHSFENMSRICNIVGAVDGTHVPIVNCPGGNNDYINRKGFPSVQLQLVVDDTLMINDAYVGWPGSTHDARVLRNSSFYEGAENGRNISPGKIIVGDGAYPLRRWLITPFRDNGHLTQQQKKYNKALSSARQCVERANAHVKGRFRRLQKVYCKKVEDISKLIMSCCILHNLCVICEDDIYDFIDINMAENVNNYMNIFQNLPSAEIVRNQIAANF